ncbi:MAG: 1-(5-phosphoribosyl)-5-[(5-phosphoribosylamino)methylideneamino] imidazole-4-carboxamide isomerase [Cyclobacteriaceae bacterium]|nr:1-(5-phosphoribosyl)-5-[(5-phosphoribosylamino)methylideneamino] imidazole-4-carboxamide isomerase [Cyclobacteriaceae bacterium]
MIIIPAIDIIDGKAVRLTKGDYSQKKIYNEDPLEVAMMFEDAGLSRLHLVDLDGAKAKRIVNYKVLERITSRTSLKVDFGGGVQSDNDIAIAFNSGAQQVTGGSIAVKNQELFEHWLTVYGPERIILGADVLNGQIAVSGWQEGSAWELNAFIENYLNKSIRYVITTDVSKDGALAGPAIDLYSKMTTDFPDLSIIASGGVASMADIHVLDKLPLYGVNLVRKAKSDENRIKPERSVQSFMTRK